MNGFKRIWVAAALLLISWQVCAQDPALSLPGNADVRIVVDISGSMKETDPQNLRRPAVRLLARTLPEGASAGLWTFGQYVNMLVPYGVVDQSWRDTAIERSEQINSVALHTNLGLAMEKAANDWAAAAPVTDGVEIWGPAEPPRAMVRGWHRRRLLVRADKTIDISAYLRSWASRVKTPSSVRVSIDVEPYSFI